MVVPCDRVAFMSLTVTLSNLLNIICEPKSKVATIGSSIKSGISTLEYEAKRIKEGSFLQDLPKYTLQGLYLDVDPEDVELFNKGVKTKDKDLYITDLTKKYGYKTETHYIETEDGYILTVFRIPGNGKIVYLQHGILSSSDDWVTSGPNRSLAYLLSDRGYDVWIGNSRGNKHSQKHVKLTPAEEDFWNFSFDELGRYDLPAVIDHMLKLSGKKNLIYIGHSQGTTAFFVMLSERPEYNNKVSFMIALAAVAWVEHINSPARVLVPIIQDDDSIGRKILGPKITPNDTTTKIFKNIVCDGNIVQNLLCMNLFFAFAGFDNSQVNYESLSSILSHSPGGIATKQLEHFSQMVMSGHFRRFDYGWKNMLVYNKVYPPDYNILNIEVPMAIFQASEDWLADNKDLEKLVRKLENNFTLYLVPYQSFAHTDFLFAKDVVKFLYSKVIEIIRSV